MMSMAFVEQPESASTRHHHTVNHVRAAALPSVIGGPGSDFTCGHQGQNQRRGRTGAASRLSGSPW